MSKHYRLYIKLPKSSRYSPVDWNAGVTVTNLIRASIFTEQEKKSLETRDLVHPDNAHIQYQFRPVKGWSA